MLCRILLPPYCYCRPAPARTFDHHADKFRRISEDHIHASYRFMSSRPDLPVSCVSCIPRSRAAILKPREAEALRIFSALRMQSLVGRSSLFCFLSFSFPLIPFVLNLLFTSLREFGEFGQSGYVYNIFLWNLWIHLAALCFSTLLPAASL